MCGRFVIQATWAEYRAYLTGFVPESAVGRNDPARYNVAPSQEIPIIRAGDDGFEVFDVRWQMWPVWAGAKHEKLRPKINARSEGAATSGFWKIAWKSGRCLIPASGFYEWTGPKDDRQPHFIHLPDTEPFAFAGLYTYNRFHDHHGAAIVTAAPTDNIASLHDRMPVILNHEGMAAWMNPETEDPSATIQMNRGDELVHHPVSKAVNKNTAQGPELIRPI